jgi:hypothetical protein
VAAHDLDHKGPLMAGGGAQDGIQRLGDPVQGGVGPDRHVGPEHVVVDRADQPHQPQEGVRGGHLGIHLARLDQLRQQLRPLLAEPVGAGQAAVATDHDQRLDPQLEQVAGGPPATLPLLELRRPGRPQDGAAAVQDPAHIGRRHPPDGLGALDQPPVAVSHRKDRDAVMHRCPHHRPDGRVHAPGVTAAGQHPDAGKPSSHLGHQAPERARTCPITPSYCDNTRHVPYIFKGRRPTPGRSRRDAAGRKGRGSGPFPQRVGDRTDAGGRDLA